MSNFTDEDSLIVIGQIVSVYGVKGWLKVRSFTQDPDDLFNYKPWALQALESGKWKGTSIKQYRAHGKGYVVQLEGCDDRNQAELLRGMKIGVNKDLLPEPDSSETYWRDLEGLRVVNLQGETLGLVDTVMETGANDVLLVKPCDSSIDEQERLIPYVGHVVNKVSIDEGVLSLDWQADY
ncbi:MAG: ribosome maturation factor RimM [Pseudomonadales bacterium]|nr:ribosome maturation factor RimM [Pseudomonadales bacterium]